MANMSDARIGGIALAGGAILDLFATLIRPGSILIEPLGRASTQVERVQVLADNAPYTHTSVLVGTLGLLTMLYGFLLLWRHVRDHGAGDAVTGLGLIFLAFAVFFIGVAGGLNHIIVHTVTHGEQDPRTLYTFAINIQLVKAGIVIIAGYGFLLGFGLLSLGVRLRASGGLHKILAAAIAVISFVALVVLGIGDHYHDWADELYTLANFAVLPLGLWAIFVGVSMYRGDEGLAMAGSE